MQLRTPYRWIKNRPDIAISAVTIGVMAYVIAKVLFTVQTADLSSQNLNSCGDAVIGHCAPAYGGAALIPILVGVLGASVVLRYLQGGLHD
jgi:hypothetical protein